MRKNIVRIFAIFYTSVLLGKRLVTLQHNGKSFPRVTQKCTKFANFTRQNYPTGLY